MKTLLIYNYLYPGGTAEVRKQMIEGEEMPMVGDIVVNLRYEDALYTVRVDEVHEGVRVGDDQHIRVIGTLERITPKVKD